MRQGLVMKKTYSFKQNVFKKSVISKAVVKAMVTATIPVIITVIILIISRRQSGIFAAFSPCFPASHENQTSV